MNDVDSAHLFVFTFISCVVENYLIYIQYLLNNIILLIIYYIT